MKRKNSPYRAFKFIAVFWQDGDERKHPSEIVTCSRWYGKDPLQIRNELLNGILSRQVKQYDKYTCSVTGRNF